MKHKIEFILGFLGGILGTIAAFVTIVIGGIDAATNETGVSKFMSHGWFAFAFSIIAIGGALLIQKKPKFAGFALIIAAVGGFLSVSLFYVIPAIILIVSGLMLILKKV